MAVGRGEEEKDNTSCKYTVHKRSYYVLLIVYIVHKLSIYHISSRVSQTCNRLTWHSNVICVCAKVKFVTKIIHTCLWQNAPMIDGSIPKEKTTLTVTRKHVTLNNKIFPLALTVHQLVAWLWQRGLCNYLKPLNISHYGVRGVAFRTGSKFIIYTNDLRNAIKYSKYILFVDDTPLFYCTKHRIALHNNICMGLNALSDWIKHINAKHQ